MILMQIRLDFYDIALMGAGLGALLGLIPLIAGFLKKRKLYGFGGFLASIVGGAIMGVLLSVPLIVLFTWLIYKNPETVGAVRTENSDQR